MTRKLAFSQIAGQGSLLLVTPALTRSYEPADLGSFQLAFAIGNILSLFLSIRIEAFVPSLPDRQAQAVRRAGILIACTISTVFLIGAVILMIGVSRSYGLILIGSILLGIVISLGTLGTAELLRSRRVGRAAARNFLTGALAASLQVLFGVMFNAGFISLMGAMILGRLLALIFTAKPCRDVTPSHIKVDLLNGLMWSRENRGALTRTSAASSLGLLNPQLPLMAMPLAYPQSIVGQYALAQRTTSSPASLVGLGLSQSFTVSVAEAMRSQSGISVKMLYSTVGRLLCLAIPAGAAVCLLGLFAFVPIFGPGWEQAGHFAAIMSPIVVTQLSVGPLAVAFALLGQPSLHMRIEIGKLVVLLVVLAVLISFNIDSVYFISCLSVVIVAGHIAVFYGLVRSFRRAATLTPSVDFDHPKEF